MTPWGLPSAPRAPEALGAKHCRGARGEAWRYRCVRESKLPPFLLFEDFHVVHFIILYASSSQKCHENWVAGPVFMDRPMRGIRSRGQILKV